MISITKWYPNGLKNYSQCNCEVLRESFVLSLNKIGMLNYNIHFFQFTTRVIIRTSKRERCVMSWLPSRHFFVCRFCFWGFDLHSLLNHSFEVGCESQGHTYVSLVQKGAVILFILIYTQMKFIFNLMSTFNTFRWKKPNNICSLYLYTALRRHV